MVYAGLGLVLHETATSVTLCPASDSNPVECATTPATTNAVCMPLVNTSWLTRVMDDYGVWTGQPGADQVLAARLDTLEQAWRETRRRVVAVSSEVGSGIVPGTASGRRYRDELGRLNARIAAGSEEAWLCTAGIPQRLR